MRLLRKDGYGITPAARTYMEPLIRGEAYPPYGRDITELRVVEEHGGEEEAGEVGRLTVDCCQ